MSLLTVILVIVAAGVILWAVDRYAPMTPESKGVLRWVVVLFLVVWLLKLFGAFEALERVRL